MDEELCEDGDHCSCFYEVEYEFWCCFCGAHNGKPPLDEEEEDDD